MECDIYQLIGVDTWLLSPTLLKGHFLWDGSQTSFVLWSWMLQERNKKKLHTCGWDEYIEIGVWSFNKGWSCKAVNKYEQQQLWRLFCCGPVCKTYLSFATVLVIWVYDTAIVAAIFIGLFAPCCLLNNIYFYYLTWHNNTL